MYIYETNFCLHISLANRGSSRQQRKEKYDDRSSPRLPNMVGKYFLKSRVEMFIGKLCLQSAFVKEQSNNIGRKAGLLNRLLKIAER